MGQEKIGIEIPEPWPLLNKWQRMHWRERKRVTERFSWLIRMAAAETLRELSGPIQLCSIHAERYHGRSRVHLPDWDGLYGGLKPVLDCLIPRSARHPHGLGIIQDDSPLHIVCLHATPLLSGENGSRSVIYIMPLNREK